LNETTPRARVARLVIRELHDEVLIYDLETNKAHCLNHTAALVWKLCDGRRTVAQLRELIEKDVGVALPEEAIWLALDQLAEFNLLTARVSKPSRLAGISRRHLIRSLGIAATLSAPLITSIVVPTPAMAASCGSLTGRDNGCPCDFRSECASDCCRDGVCKPGVGNCF